MFDPDLIKVWILYIFLGGPRQWVSKLFIVPYFCISKLVFSLPFSTIWLKTLLKGYECLKRFIRFTKEASILKVKKFANSAVQSNKICGKVRKSQRQNFATKVRKSIKSFKMYHLKEKCKKNVQTCQSDILGFSARLVTLLDHYLWYIVEL